MLSHLCRISHHSRNGSPGWSQGLLHSSHQRSPVFSTLIHTVLFIQLCTAQGQKVMLKSHIKTSPDKKPQANKTPHTLLQLLVSRFWVALFNSISLLLFLVFCLCFFGGGVGFFFFFFKLPPSFCASHVLEKHKVKTILSGILKSS